MSSKYDYIDEEDDEKVDGKYSDVKQHGEIDPLELLNRVQKYFYEDDEFTRTFEQFAMDECEVIDLTSDEYKLEYTAAFEKYKMLFERKLERFIEKQGCTPLNFYEALRERTESDPDGMFALFGQILVAVVDFDIFMVMMRETAQSCRRSLKK